MVIECDKSQTKRYFDAQVTPFYEKESLFLLLVCNSVIASVFGMLLLRQIRWGNILQNRLFCAMGSC